MGHSHQAYLGNHARVVLYDCRLTIKRNDGCFHGSKRRNGDCVCLLWLLHRGTHETKASYGSATRAVHLGTPQLFAIGRASLVFPPPWIEGLNVDLVLSSEESAQGGTVAVGVPVFFTCPECYGTGRDWLFLCSNCAARGIIEAEETVCVRIPPMLPERSVIEVPIHGLGVHNLFLRLHTRISRRV